MFDIGWTELLVVAMVAVIVVGPKDLPGMLRGFGKTVGNLRRMANEFQGQFSDALREAETQAGLDDAKKSMSGLADINPMADFKNSINPLNDIGKDLDSALNSDPKPETVDETEAPIPDEESESDTVSASLADTEGQKADKT